MLAAAAEEEHVLLEVERVVETDRATLWRVLTDLERQPEWMRDAKDVHVLTPHRRGVGVVVRCPTRLLGITVQDVMRFTVWDEPRRLEVVHLGRIITGTGAFHLDELGDERTRIRWVETIEPPFGAVGAWGARVLVLPIVRRIFAGSLRNLAALAERETRRR